MTIFEALELAKKGHKIRSKSWKTGYWYLYNGEFYTNDGNPVKHSIIMSYILNDDGEWEIYEEVFEVGDWLTDGKVVIKYVHLSENEETDTYFYEDKDRFIEKNNVRKASQEEIDRELERRNWMCWGRKLGEWRIGDIVYDLNSIRHGQKKGMLLEISSDILKDKKEKNFKMICPTETRVDKLHF